MDAHPLESELDVVQPLIDYAQAISVPRPKRIASSFEIGQTCLVLSLLSRAQLRASQKHCFRDLAAHWEKGCEKGTLRSLARPECRAGNRSDRQLPDYHGDT